MIVVTIKHEKSSTEGRHGDSPYPVAIHVELDNTQAAYKAEAMLRPGEAVEHRLRLDLAGIVNVKCTGR